MNFFPEGKATSEFIGRSFLDPYEFTAEFENVP